MNDLYPPGTFELPGENEELKTYIFEFSGEVEVEGYSEEDAEEYFIENIGDVIRDGLRNGTIQIQ